MTDNPSIWDLLDQWLIDTYGKYKHKKLPIIKLDITKDHSERLIAKIKCVPCMGYVEVAKSGEDDSQFGIVSHFKVDGVYFRPEDPSFTFANTFGPKINQHLWHHQMGPLYEQGWKLEKGTGVW